MPSIPTPPPNLIPFFAQFLVCDSDGDVPIANMDLQVIIDDVPIGTGTTDADGLVAFFYPSILEENPLAQGIPSEPKIELGPPIRGNGSIVQVLPISMPVYKYVDGKYKLVMEVSDIVLTKRDIVPLPPNCLPYPREVLPPGVLPMPAWEPPSRPARIRVYPTEVVGGDGGSVGGE